MSVFIYKDKNGIPVLNSRDIANEIMKELASVQPIHKDKEVRKAFAHLWKLSFGKKKRKKNENKN
jgi:hypothetical protein